MKMITRNVANFSDRCIPFASHGRYQSSWTLKFSHVSQIHPYRSRFSIGVNSMRDIRINTGSELNWRQI
jgi:hypothetical protein